MQRLHAQIPVSRSALHREMWLRYLAATFVTLLALAGAQLIVRNDFIFALSVVTLLGTPVSMSLRLRQMRVGSLLISRPLWNAITVLGTFVVAGFYLAWTLRGVLEGWNGSMAGFWLRVGAGDSMALLIQVFLIFAAFRSFALISDKDCTLATVPSFSVLLLLVPVHKGIEVVAYFVAWTIWATILFALDHRSEQRARVVGIVASPQYASRMVARSLGWVLAIALAGSVGVSALLTMRSPEDRSNTETALSSIAMRLTQLALSMPDIPTSTGPEHQINFSSGPPLPTQTVLWRVASVSLRDELLQPQYLRLLSLTQYKNNSWTQSDFGKRPVKQRLLRRSEWPLPQPNPNNLKSGAANFSGPTFAVRPSADDAARGIFAPTSSRIRLDRRTILPPGFPVASTDPRKRFEFGYPATGVRHFVRAQTINLGFLPALPSARTLRLPDSNQNEVRTRRDGAIDVGVIQSGRVARIYSLVPRLREYGFVSGTPPTRVVRSRTDSPILTGTEREAALRLPPTVPRRVGALARDMLRDAQPDESNFKKASRMALALADGAVYTLRPPSVPVGRDAADYFLFEGSKRGYCTYFAGALAVLCRTQGIPARVATGFASMEMDEQGMAIVRDANAHAWTEVWVDGWGWALVDATPASDRGDNAPNWIENWHDVFGAVADNLTRWLKTHWPLLLAGAVLSALSFLALIKRRELHRWWTRRRAPERKAELARHEIFELYHNSTRPLARRFRARRPSETPEEWLRAASQTAPTAQSAALQTLTELYVRAAFSPTPVSEQTLQNARDAARALKMPRR